MELLVLSACRTAVGDQSAELGFAGLAIATGAKSALASLWYVSDASTLGLMTEFYTHLQNSTIKAEALRQAQLAMLRGNVSIEGENCEALNNNGGDWYYHQKLVRKRVIVILVILFIGQALLWLVVLGNRINQRNPVF